MITVDAASAGLRLDALLGADERVGSRAEAQRLIDDGRVLVNGAAVVKRRLMHEGETVSVALRPAPTSALVPQHMDLLVPYEDEHLIVVDKPAGVVSHPSKGHETGTLVHGLLARGISGGDEPFRPGIVHRLDRDTSGLLIVAKNDRAHRALQAMLRERTIDRRYQVLVHGEFPPALTVDQPIGRDRRNRLRMSTRSDTLREARTRFRRLQTFGQLSLLEARLDTGRTHQIRVHLEFAGFPVVGDSVYGRGRDTLGLGRQFLHSCSLGFEHPITEQPLRLESPLPDDLRRVVERLSQ